MTQPCQHSDRFKDSNIPPTYLLGRLFFRGTVADASAMEEVFEENGLEWTIAHSPQLINKAHTGKYRVREGHLPPFGLAVSRADVADSMIKAGEDRSLSGKIIRVCN